MTPEYRLLVYLSRLFSIEFNNIDYFCKVDCPCTYFGAELIFKDFFEIFSPSAQSAQSFFGLYGF